MMIAFETWLPQILGYCELICDDSALRRAWIEHDTSGTSVTDFDELYEQIFDDLDSGFFQTELSKYLPDRGEMNTALSNFLESLRQVDRERTATIELRDPWTLLASEQWGVLRDAAQAVLNSN